MNLGQKSLICALVLFGFVISACQDEKGAGDYSGVSDLIASRNKARYEDKKNPTKKTVRKKVTTNSKSTSNTQKSEELSSIILYEEDVKIVGSDSQRTLAKGVAYINKKGQIVRIKILKE